ncbi:MAG: RuBisCO accumulation factor 1 [Prochlorotrichaceae cyanobacterium]
MTDSTPPAFLGFATPSPALDPETCQALLHCLRRKEQTWVDWGKACQQLQRSGYTSVRIFEETGLEPVQQNQVMVAAQVYESILPLGVEPSVQAYFQHRGSDLLYEFRSLTPPQRLKVATFAQQRQFDSEQARTLAKAYREFQQLQDPPPGFSDHPGDALAYQYWRWARERSDLQDRSRLVAQGLQMVQSPEARQQLQSLLLDWAPQPQQVPPRWPFYRLNAEEGAPLILPLLGQLPVSRDPQLAAPLSPQVESGFSVYDLAAGGYVAVPGWSVIQDCRFPAALLAQVADLPHLGTLSQDLGLQETDAVLVIVDLEQRDWQVDRFFWVERSGQSVLEWLPQDPVGTLPDLTVCGQVVLVLRPPRQEEIPAADDGDWLLAE